MLTWAIAFRDDLVVKLQQRRFADCLAVALDPPNARKRKRVEVEEVEEVEQVPEPSQAPAGPGAEDGDADTGPPMCDQCRQSPLVQQCELPTGRRKGKVCKRCSVLRLPCAMNGVRRSGRSSYKNADLVEHLYILSAQMEYVKNITDRIHGMVLTTPKFVVARERRTEAALQTESARHALQEVSVCFGQ